MKPIDKKDMPKLIALVVMAVFAFGFGIYQFTSSSTAQRPAPPPAESAKPKPGATPAPPPGIDQEAVQRLALGYGGRDPFSPNGSAAPTPKPTPVPSPSPSPFPGIGENPATIHKTDQHLPNPRGRTVGDVAQKGGAVDPVELPPPPAPTLNITGLIVAEAGTGSQNMVITREGEAPRFFVEGDSVGNGWTISAIRLGSVVITDPTGTKSETLRFGR